MTVADDGSLHITSASNGSIFINGVNISQLAASVARLEALFDHDGVPSTMAPSAFPELCILPPAQQPIPPTYSETYRIVGDYARVSAPSANQLAITSNGTIVTSIANPSSILRFAFNNTAGNYTQERVSLLTVSKFGESVALSNDGTVSIYGSNILNDGDVHIFDGNLSPQAPAQLVSSQGLPNQLGSSVATSGDGLTVAAGIPGQDVEVVTIITTNVIDHGSVMVLNQVSGAWIQEPLISGANLDAEDEFGRNVALSHDGKTLVVSAHLANEGDGFGQSHAGVVIVFERSAATNKHVQQARLAAITPTRNAQFGYRLALSGDGTTLVVVSHAQDGMHIFSRTSSQFLFKTPATYIAPVYATTASRFGHSLAVSACGCVIVAGAELDRTLEEGAGAVYVFSKGNTTTHTLLQKLLPGMGKAGNTAIVNGHFGHAVAVAADGRTVVAAALRDANNKTAVHVFDSTV